MRAGWPAAGRQPIVSGDGMQVHDFVHMDDIARALGWRCGWLAASPPTASAAYSTRDEARHMVIGRALAMACAAVLGGALGGPRPDPAVPGDAEYNVADTRRAASTLG